MLGDLGGSVMNSRIWIFMSKCEWSAWAKWLGRGFGVFPDMHGGALTGVLRCLFSYKCW